MSVWRSVEGPLSETVLMLVEVQSVGSSHGNQQGFEIGGGSCLRRRRRSLRNSQRGECRESARVTSHSIFTDSPPIKSLMISNYSFSGFKHFYTTKVR